ncbi:MAG: TIR domain-containing protein [Nitrospirales bacterium]|nr:TIR domain-containing protein [Nitrospirales bacterium]
MYLLKVKFHKNTTYDVELLSFYDEPDCLRIEFDINALSIPRGPQSPFMVRKYLSTIKWLNVALDYDKVEEDAAKWEGKNWSCNYVVELDSVRFKIDFDLLKDGYPSLNSINWLHGLAILHGRFTVESWSLDPDSWGLNNFIYIDVRQQDMFCYDAFISHASEDKADFVRPLALSLRNRRLKVWYDEFELIPGKSIRASIDEGLSASRHGIVVLSN